MPNLDRQELPETLAEQLDLLLAKRLDPLKLEVSSIVEASRSTNESVRLIGSRMDALQAEITASKQASATSFDEMRSQIRSVQIEFEDVKRRLDRQGRQLTSLENFPMFPQDVRPSSVYRVTTTQSCSQPKRVRVGYTG